MSSAILYLAIVAIWALVLVPRWLRPHHPSSRHVDHFEPPGGTGHVELAWADDDVTGEEDWEDPAGHAGEDAPAAGPGHGRVPGHDQAPAHGHGGASAADRADGRDRLPARAGRPSPAERRARILRARRRTLITFVMLTAGAGGLAVTHRAAWWVTLPPASLLAGFVLLLREAARIDAERARAASRRARATASTGDGAGAVTAGDAYRAVRPERRDHVPGPEPTAEIIDISDRVGDQLYDQYTDAALRAVGD